MEVLEKVGTPEQKEKWLKPLLNGEIRSAFGMTEPGLASSDAKNIACRAELVGDEWVINGEKYYISGAGDPRCKIMILMVQTSPDAPTQFRQSQILVPIPTPGPDHPGPDDRVRPRRRAARPHAPEARERAGAEGEHPAGRRPRLRDQPGAPGPRPHPPLHALDRPGRAGARPDGQARLDPHRVRQADHPARQEPRGGGPRPDRDRGDAADGAEGGHARWT